MDLYFDYDDWLVDLAGPWLEDLNKQNNTSYVKADIDNFYWFKNQPGGLNFLEKNNDVYKNVVVRDGIFDLFVWLEKNELLDNVTIVTSTHPNSYRSKIKHFEEKICAPLNIIFQKEFGYNFPLTFENDFVTTSQKWKLNFNNAVLVDDAVHNVQKVVDKNPYAYAIVVNQSHNQELKTGKRISRLTNINDFFKQLVLISVQSFDRRNNPKHRHLVDENNNKKRKKRK